MANRYAHDLNRVASPPASPSHSRNEVGQRTEDTSHMSFFLFKNPTEKSHQATFAYMSLARTLPHASQMEGCVGKWVF